MQVESSELICISPNLMMSLFSILTHLLYHQNVLKVVSYYEQELRDSISHLRLYFFLLWKINPFVSGVHIQVMHLYLLLLQIFRILLYNKEYHQYLPYYAWYIFTHADQNQQLLVLRLKLEPRWLNFRLQVVVGSSPVALTMNPFFIEISF